MPKEMKMHPAAACSPPLYQVGRRASGLCCQHGRLYTDVAAMPGRRRVLAAARMPIPVKKKKKTIWPKRTGRTRMMTRRRRSLCPPSRRRECCRSGQLEATACRASWRRRMRQISNSGVCPLLFRFAALIKTTCLPYNLRSHLWIGKRTPPWWDMRQ